MVFESRQPAGCELGHRLQELEVEADLVAGLPRGGVVVATGATAQAAIYSARHKHAREIILAVPMALASACARLARITGKVVTLVTDPNFQAVGQYYKHFHPDSDEEVLALLRRERADYRSAR